jgi:hypothetical protein
MLCSYDPDFITLLIFSEEHKLCWIWDSCSSDYYEHDLLCFDAVWFGRSPPTLDITELHGVTTQEIVG